MRFNQKTASILLALVISARATSFLFSKLCLTTMTAYSLISVRFITATLIMLILFQRHIFGSFSFNDAKKGFLFGTLYFFTLLCEHIGLKTINSGTASLLENLAIILVPFAETFLSRKCPEKKTVFRAILAIAGVFFLSMKGQSFEFAVGELYLLCAAAFYSAAIIVTSRLSTQGDAFNMGFFQVCTIAFWGTLSATLSGNYTLPTSTEQYLMVLILAAVCTCFGFTLQPVAQSKVPSEKAALFCAINPLIAGILGTIILHESFTPFSICGTVLILFALIIR
ncbi:MAG: DMT family transporter [bacterium]|nr:DMT family transporter [bacterium]